MKCLSMGMKREGNEDGVHQIQSKLWYTISSLPPDMRKCCSVGLSKFICYVGNVNVISIKYAALYSCNLSAYTWMALVGT